MAGGTIMTWTEMPDRSLRARPWLCNPARIGSTIALGYNKEYEKAVFAGQLFIPNTIEAETKR